MIPPSFGDTHQFHSTHIHTHTHSHSQRYSLETSLVFKARFPQAPQAMLRTVQQTVAVQQTFAE